jgi:hypothetical protein
VLRDSRDSHTNTDTDANRDTNPNTNRNPDRDTNAYCDEYPAVLCGVLPV